MTGMQAHRGCDIRRCPTAIGRKRGASRYPAYYLHRMNIFTEAHMSRRTIAAISPMVIAGAAVVRLGWLLLIQFHGGFSPVDFWNFWLVQLVIGGWQ